MQIRLPVIVAAILAAVIDRADLIAYLHHRGTRIWAWTRTRRGDVRSIDVTKGR